MRKVWSLFLIMSLLFGMLPVSAAGNSTGSGGGGAGVALGSLLRGTIQVPANYVFSGEEELEICISESYDSADYEYQTTAPVSGDGTYEVRIPSSLVGNYAVSAYPWGFHAPVIAKPYNCNHDAMIPFDGNDVSGVDFTIEGGHTLSGQLTLGEDAILENGVLSGWICAYEYQGKHLDMAELGEGQYHTSFESESGNVSFALAIPKNAENIVLAARVNTNATGTGVFKSNILSEYVYYAGESSSLTYTDAQVLSATADISDIEIDLPVGTSMSVSSQLPDGVSGYSRSATLSFEDKSSGNVFSSNSIYIYTSSDYRNFVFPREYLNKEVYLSYDLNYGDDALYTDPLYINPDGSLAKTKEEAVAHTLTGANSVSFTAGLKTDYSSGIKGTISFEEGCVLNGSFYCDITAMNTKTYQYAYASVNQTGIGEYKYVLPVSEEGTYIVWASIRSYDSSSNLSECDYYYHSTGMVYRQSDAEVIDTAVKSSGIDFEFKKTKPLQGKLILDGEWIADEQFKPEICIQSEFGSYREGITLRDDFTFEVQLPANIQGDCTAYVYAGPGSSIIPDYYYYKNAATNDRFDADTVGVVDFNLETGDLIRGKITLPQGIDTSYSKSVELCLATEQTNGYLTVNQYLYTTIDSGETEQEFIFAVEKDAQADYVVYGTIQSVQGLYNGIFYYTGNQQSSILQQKAMKVKGGTEDILFSAIPGTNSLVTITNPDGEEYTNGRYTIDFGNFNETGYFYLNGGQTGRYNLVLTEEHVGLEAYASYAIDKHFNVPIYVNPDGSLTNNKAEAKPHTITPSTSFNMTLSSDEDLYTIPAIKGKLVSSKDAYISSSGGDDASLYGSVYLSKDGLQKGYQDIDIRAGEAEEFHFELEEIGDYILSIYLGNWSYDTNIICNKTLYYTGSGWSEDMEDAVFINNQTAQDLTLPLPEYDVMKGKVTFPEGTYLNGEIRYEITYTSLDGNASKSKTGYISHPEDFEYQATGIDNVDEYHVSIRFGSSYSQDYDTNIPYGKRYYYTEKGLSTDETAARKVFKSTDTITFPMPVLPCARGTITFPEGTELSGEGYLYITLVDENGNRIHSREINIDTAQTLDFAIAGNEDAEKYSISVNFNSGGHTTALEEGPLYYTKEGMTSNVNARKYYTMDELSNIELKLRNKRYVTGKLVSEEFVNYDTTLSGWAEFRTDTMRMSVPVEFDEDLTYRVEIPTNIDGSFTFGISFADGEKNNILKDKYFYYCDENGEPKKIAHPHCENIPIQPETGYVFSGVVKLPEDAVVYENQDLTGTVYYSTLSSNFRIPYGETEGEFFMVLTKEPHSSLLYTSTGNGIKGKAKNLYLGQVYYKDDNTSVVNPASAAKYKVSQQITDAQLMLLTGEVYTITLTKPAGVNTSEDINVYGKIGNETVEDTAVTIGSQETTATASLVIPADYNTQDMYIYYNLYYDNNNTLYKENVYINPDESLAGDQRTAQPFTIGTGGADLSVALADYTENTLRFPEYLYLSPYPYKNHDANAFQYEYTDGDCDFLKVTFSGETYLAYDSYSRRDSLSIHYGDGQTFGPYYRGELAGKTMNIPGTHFEAAITRNADHSAFGFAIDSIEPKVYTLESNHPYVSTSETVHSYTHTIKAEGLRLHFSEETSFSGRAKISYTDKNGNTKTDSYYSYNLAGSSIDIRGNEFTITLPANTAGNAYGFSIEEIEEIEYFDVIFQNYDGSLLYKTEVEKGTDTYYRGSTPVRERDENYIYRFEGWDQSLETITKDLVVTAQYSENPYATVTFKNTAQDTEPLYTDYVILGESASFDGAVAPSKASTSAKGYLFAGWDKSLKNIQGDVVITAEFEERDILLQSQHPYGSEEQTYTYTGNADSISLVFSSDSYIGEDEHLYIFDEAGNQQFDISGENLAGREYTLVGKTATLRLEGTGTHFGYALVQVIPKWHNFSNWVQYTDPTCTDEGYEYRWCYNCDTPEERTVPALGHSYGGWAEDPAGNIYRECSRCSEREILEGDMSDCGMVNISVVDAITTKPLGSVTITSYDEAGNEAVWYTNAEGVASQILPRGVNNLVVFSEGYLMRNISLTVNGGVTDAPVIGLTKKPAVECKLEATIMDMEEIKAAGIDTTDPLNSHVYKYRINLGFGEPQTVYFNKVGDYIDRGNLVVRNNETHVSATIHPINDKYYLVIYGQSKWLKEMFDVELVATNTSNTDTVEDLVAELNIPDGMSLAAMNGVSQRDVQAMGTLAKGESKSVHWYLRGDRAGEYNLSAKLTGTLMPFGEQFGYQYTTDEPVKVYAGNALRMNLIVPAVATYGEDYTVKIEIENVSDRSVYNLSNSIDKILQSKFLTVDQDGYEKYFEENALGYVAVDELKPGEKIVAELKSNILFQSDIIKNKIDSLANRLQNETDVLAIFNSYKSTLDLFNDNYDIIDNALGNLTRSEEHLTDDQKAAVEELTDILSKCKLLVRDGVSSRAMYFINHLKQENTLEELTKLSQDSNYYIVWNNESIRKLAQELCVLYDEAMLPENCGDYDIYEDVKRIIEAVPVTFWLRDIFVAKLEGSTTEIPYTVTVIPSEKSYTGVTNISNYYYNVLTHAIDRLSQPWYTEVMGDLRDPDGVAQANEIIKTDMGKTLTFAVTDVSGDTRFHAWVEGESGKPFEVSSTAEDVEVTESGITFTGPAYLSVSALTQGKGTLYVKKVDEIATFSAAETVYSFKLEAGEAHTCASDQWVDLVTAYDDQDGYKGKYCDTCGQFMDIQTVTATDECSAGSYAVSEETIANGTFTCKMTFDEKTPARSAKAILVMKNQAGVTVHIGTDDIKIKPNTSVDIAVDVPDVPYAGYQLLLWDNFAKLRPVANN